MVLKCGQCITTLERFPSRSRGCLTQGNFPLSPEVGFGFGWLAFSSFLFPFHVMNFVHLCPKEKKKKKEREKSTSTTRPQAPPRHSAQYSETCGKYSCYILNQGCDIFQSIAFFNSSAVL